MAEVKLLCFDLWLSILKVYTLLLCEGPAADARDLLDHLDVDFLCRCDGLMHKRGNSSALAMDWHLLYIKLSVASSLLLTLWHALCCGLDFVAPDL